MLKLLCSALSPRDDFLSAQTDTTPCNLAFTEAQLRQAVTAASLAATNPARPLLPWLQLTSSLTARLAQQFGSKPGLIVLGEGLEDGQPWEHGLLGATSPVYARHIALTVDNEPLVLARTVTTQGAGMDALTQLRTRPLAELLFEDAAWRREATVQYLTLADSTPGRGCYWHNRSLQAGLVVQEFFLPSLSARLSE